MLSSKKTIRQHTTRLAAIGLLSLGAALPGLCQAQETLIDLVRAGQREAVLAAITSPDLDLNTRASDGSTALHWATYAVDHDLVEALLRAGAQADVSNHYGATPLTEAVKLGDARLVRLLLDAGADANSPNLDQQTALMLASHIGSVEIVRMLLDKGADVNVVETFRGQTALMWASGQNHPEIAELLVKHGADVHVRAKHDDWPRQMTSEPRAQFRQTGGLTALLYATRSGCYRCAVAIVEAGADVDQPNPDGITPLINALDNRNFDLAMYLLDQGARPSVWDMNGRTPLYVAIDMNSFTPRSFTPQGFGFGGESVERERPKHTALDVARRLLVDIGVDPNHQLTRMRPNGPGRGRFADYMMRGGTGALLVAAMSYDTEAIELLLANGAEVDLPNVFQITPLMAAAGMTGSGRPPGSGQTDIQDRAVQTIALLLDGGADINAQVTNSRTFTAKMDAYVQGRDNEGKTALIAAADNGWDKVVEHLLARGADPSLRDADGNTALDTALAPVAQMTGPGTPPSQDGRQRTAALLSAALEQ